MLHGDDHVLDVDKARRDAAGREVRHQRERLLRGRAVPAPDAQARRPLSRVATARPEAAATSWMPWTRREIGAQPRTLGNVLLAGELRVESKLHRKRQRTRSLKR